jgi:CelD/BcsL family acetyltransferase involved in cellulose biosynthesis
MTSVLETPGESKAAAGWRVVELRSTDEIRRHAMAWDRLWVRSAISIPTARAETVAQWYDYFTPGEPLRVVVVETEGNWLAALPLANRRLGWLRAACLPTNEWLTGGDLLLDADAPADAVLDLLVDGLRRVPWPLLWLNDVEIESSRWLALAEALKRRGMPCDIRAHSRVGRLPLERCWPAYRARWSRKHRQNMAASIRRLESLGTLRLRRVQPRRAGDVEQALREAFEIEHRGWKGGAHTSVLSTPGMFGYFVAQARQLGRWGQLEVAFLELNERPIAFIVAQTARGVFYSCKIGYEPALADHSPGQVLRCLLLESLSADATIGAVDFQGPLTDAHHAWRPESYLIGRLGVALGLTGRMALTAYRLLRPQIRSIASRLSAGR